MEVLSLSLNELVRSQRLHKQMSVKDLSKISQVSFSYIYAVESGKKQLKYNFTAVRLLKALDIDFHQLASNQAD